MHTEDGEEDLKSTSGYYGPLPTFAGILIAGGLIWFMFTLADGFA
ncbi:MAG: hypothetical protein AAF557_24605 [Pseudomonadota bacterium]